MLASVITGAHTEGTDRLIKNAPGWRSASAISTINLAAHGRRAHIT